MYDSFSVCLLCVCVDECVSEAHQAGGSLGPPASYTESRSSSEGWFACSGPAQALPAGSSLECPYHCFQRTTGRKRWGRKVSQGKRRETSRMMPEEVNSPSQRIRRGWWSILGCHCWTPGSRTTRSRSWNKTWATCWIYKRKGKKNCAFICVCLCLTHSRHLALVLRLPWTPSPCEHLSRTSGSCPLSLHTTLHLSCYLHRLSPGNRRDHNTCCWVLWLGDILSSRIQRGLSCTDMQVV